MPNDQRRKVILTTYLGILLVGILYYIFIQITGWSVPCSYYSKFGKQCGGCGTTRMMLSLIQLDFKSAFAYNPLVLSLMIAWHIITISAFVGKPRFVLKPLFLTFAVALTVISIILFGIFRTY